MDKYYVPTRYPNAWAEETIKFAENIIGWVEERLREKIIEDARGRAWDCDIDILVIGGVYGSLPERLRNLDVPVGYQIIALNLGEFRVLLERGEPMTIEAAKYGVVLRDDLKIFQANTSGKSH